MNEKFPCEHNYEHQGIVFSEGHQRGGSSARDVIYEDRYFCTKCLMIVDRNARVFGSNYEKPIAGSVPK